ncbi:MAG: aldo/keto reductase [Bacteroidia bacterium]|nr:aldo/keto reductase [Bacteroidia bacterium]
MQYQKLGNSSLNVSIISLGCMSLGTDQTKNERIIHAAIDQGINFFDTADLYDKGLNEENVGKVLKEKRQNVYLASKVGNEWRADGSGWDWNPHPDYIKKSIHKSLQRLGTDYLDLYQLHGGTMEDPIDETIGAFEDLKQEGLIRYYGISSIRPNVIRAWTEKSHMSSVMIQYSLLDRRPEEFSLDHLHAHGVSVLVRGGLAKGLLVDKEARPYLGYTAEEVKEAREAVYNVSGPLRSPAQVALQYSLGHAAVCSIVSGASKLEQILENTGAASSPALSMDERISLQTSIRPIRYEKHR